MISLPTLLNDRSGGATHADDELISDSVVRAANSDPSLTRAANRPRATLAEGLARLTAYEQGLTREASPISQVRIDPDQVVAGGRTYRLTSVGRTRLCHRLQAPSAYLDRLSPELRSSLLQHHIAEQSFASQRLTDANSVIVSRDGVFLDFLRGDLLTLDSAAVLEAVAAGVGPDATTLEVQELEVANEGFSTSLVSPRMSDEARPGDILSGGIRVQHSLVGDHATTVMAFVHRVVCANGLVHRHCVGRRSTARSSPRTRRQPSDRAEARQLQFQQIQRLVTETWSRLRALLQAIQNLQQEKFALRELAQLLRRARAYSERVMKLLEQAWVAEGSEATAFGALNALTWVATHAQELTGRQREVLSRLGGIFANHREHICPQCFSIIPA